MSTASPPLLRTARVAIALISAILWTACDLAGSGGQPRAELDPAPGTYTEGVWVSANTRGLEAVFWSRDPDATVDEFERFDGLWVPNDVSFRYYVASRTGRRGPISRAEYVIEDSTPPTVDSPTLRAYDIRYSGYTVEWEAYPEPDGDSTAGATNEAPEAHPRDDVTDWWQLEFAVYSSSQDNIASFDQAEANGTLEMPWQPERNRLRYSGSRPDSLRYFNVFVRDLDGNIAAYESASFRTPRAMSIYAADAGADDQMVLNRATGGFNPSVDTRSQLIKGSVWRAFAVALGNLDGDRYDDLAAISGDGINVNVIVNWYAAEGNGFFSDIPGTPTPLASESLPAAERWIIVEDLDGTGTDEIIYNLETPEVEIRHADGTLVQKLTGSSAQEGVVGDVTGDGAPDIIVRGAPLTTDIVVYRNSGGSFSESDRWLTPDGTRGMEIADVDGDGNGDLVVAAPAAFAPPRMLVYLSNGDGTFGSDSGLLGTVDLGTTNVSAADFDLDGDIDLFLGNDANFLKAPESRVILNRGDGTFDVAAAIPTNSAAVPNYWSADSVVADINGDGFPDVVERFDPGASSSPVVHLNNYPNGTIDSGPLAGGPDTIDLAVGQIR